MLQRAKEKARDYLSAQPLVTGTVFRTKIVGKIPGGWKIRGFECHSRYIVKLWDMEVTYNGDVMGCEFVRWLSHG